MGKVILVSAVKNELDDIISFLGGKWEKDQAVFTYKRIPFTAIISGIGLVNSAMRLTQCLSVETKDISEIWMVGSCGSYDPSIARGDVIVASEEINGDLGIQGKDGWESPENFGFNFLKTKDNSYIHRYPCSTPEFPNPAGDYKAYVGPLLSLSTVSGSFARAKILYNRFMALGENMEGAAAAQVAAYFGKSFIEIRGVSNKAGDRDKANWNFPLALRNSQEVALQILLKFYNLE